MSLDTPEPQNASQGVPAAVDFIADNLRRAHANLADSYHDGKIDPTALAAYLGQWTAVVLMEALRRRDPDEADALATWIDECLTDGQVASELVGQWLDQFDQGQPLTDIGNNRRLPGGGDDEDVDEPLPVGDGQARS